MASSSPLDDFGDRVEHLPVLFAVHKVHAMSPRLIYRNLSGLLCVCSSHVSQSLYGGKGDDLHSTFVPSETDVTSMVALCYELDAG